MTTYICMLRGINVSGQKLIRMEELTSMFESLELHHVRTYIQSGNIVFGTMEADSSLLTEQIAAAIKTTFGFDVAVILRTREELEQIIRDNPFPGMEGIDRERLYVTFLDGLPDAAGLAAIEGDYSPEQYIHLGCEIYLYCPTGYGRTRLSNNFFEQKLKRRATSRNWKTVRKLLEMASS